jgi:hypothetical protein
VLVPLLLSWLGVAVLEAPVALGFTLVPVLARWFGVELLLVVLPVVFA